MLTLYYTPGTCADVVLMMANALNIELKIVKVDISKSTPQTETGEDFTHINPKGYVPALGLENGEIISELVAICAYLSEQKPGNNLFPLTGKGLVDQLQWFNYLGTEIHKNIMPFFMRFFGVEIGNEWPAIAEANLKRRYGYINDILANQSYLTGDTLTSADLYLFMSTLWADKINIDLSNFTSLMTFKALMQARED